MLARVRQVWWHVSRQVVAAVLEHLRVRVEQMHPVLPNIPIDGVPCVVGAAAPCARACLHVLDRVGGGLEPDVTTDGARYVPRQVHLRMLP